MIKMARQFKENKVEDELAGELDSLIYSSKKVDAAQLTQNK
jgi:hypothetical protein